MVATIGAFIPSPSGGGPGRGKQNLTKEAGNNKLDKIALRFWSDLAAAIEQNRRRSSATSRILRLSCGQIWPEDEMQDVHVIVASLLSSTNCHNDIYRQ